MSSISVKPLTTENITSPKICKITVHNALEHRNGATINANFCVFFVGPGASLTSFQMCGQRWRRAFSHRRVALLKEQEKKNTDQLRVFTERHTHQTNAANLPNNNHGHCHVRTTRRSHFPIAQLHAHRDTHNVFRKGMHGCASLFLHVP